jgi:hypothetical protein
VSAIVVNRIKLTVPAEEVLADVEREVPPIIRALPGFERFSVAKVGHQEVVVVIFWATAADAAHGGSVIGPGAFNTWVAPRAVSQDRVVAELAIDRIGPG